jgi:predicted RNA polymerase sigma factor
LDGLAGDSLFATSHGFGAVRAHLLERAGHRDEAIRHYRRAAQRTTSTPERNYLLLHAARLNELMTPSSPLSIECERRTSQVP